MTCKKFLLICQSLPLSSRADDAANDQKKGTAAYDRLCKIKPPYSELRNTCKNYYHPTQNISINERMVASKSCIGLKQYMKSKPVCWDYKLFVLADSSNSYTWDFFVYEGRSQVLSGNGLSYDSVMQLVNTNLLGAGYKPIFTQVHCFSVTCSSKRSGHVGPSKTNSLNSKSQGVSGG